MKGPKVTEWVQNKSYNIASFKAQVVKKWGPSLHWVFQRHNRAYGFRNIKCAFPCTPYAVLAPPGYAGTGFVILGKRGFMVQIQAWATLDYTVGCK